MRRRSALATILAYVLFAHATAAFSLVPSSSAQVSLRSASYNVVTTRKQRITAKDTALRYRELDDDDTETTGISVQSRTPPGFRTQDALTSQLQEQAPKSGVNVPLCRAILFNQVLILVLASAVGAGILTVTGGFDWVAQSSNIFDWVGAGGGEVDLLDFALTPSRLGSGLLGAIPLIGLGSLIERSDKREFANVNFSTIFMVMTLLGRRKKPRDEFLPERLQGKRFPLTTVPDALICSLAIASLTGFCEEIVFRRIVPSLLYRFTNADILAALFGQATLFGLGHRTQGTSSKENSIVTGLQAVNGLWFGVLYLITGGDLVVCMIAHALYDFQVFFFTWLSANAQSEYAEGKYLTPFQDEVLQELQQLRAPKDVVDKCKKLFFTFDYDKNETISLSEIRKGIAYLAIETSTRAPPQSEIDSAFYKFSGEGTNRLTFPEFLKLFVSLTSTSQPAII